MPPSLYPGGLLVFGGNVSTFSSSEEEASGTSNLTISTCGHIAAAAD